MAPQITGACVESKICWLDNGNLLKMICVLGNKNLVDKSILMDNGNLLKKSFLTLYKRLCSNFLIHPRPSDTDSMDRPNAIGKIAIPVLRK